jgi:hypothetical protein
VGEGDRVIIRDKYRTGSGDATIYYRIGASKAACESAGWTAYSGEFSTVSTPWVQVRLVTS